MSKLRFAFVLFLIATLFGIVATIDSYLAVFLWNKQIHASYAYWEFLGSTLWFAIFPVISFLSRRFPLQKSKLAVSLGIHLVAAIGLATIHSYLQHHIWLFLGVWCPCKQATFSSVAITIYKLSWRMPVYLVIVTVCHSINYYHRLREEELKAVRLESELAQARLNALKASLQPDLVFQAFSDIADMIDRDVKRASRMIVSLADHLRSTLNPKLTAESGSGPVQPLSCNKSRQQPGGFRDGSRARRPHHVRWQWISVGWIIMGIFFTTRIVLFRMSQNSSLSVFSWIFLLAPWFLWGLLTPFLSTFWKRYPLEANLRIRNLVFHGLVGASIWILTISCALLTSAILHRFTGNPARDFLLDTVSVGVTSHLAIYWTFVFFLRANRYYSSYLQRELAVSSLEFQISIAHLHALKMQLHPHFLFNSLHAIVSLLHENREAAQRMLQQLRLFLKLSLEELTVQKVPLSKEMEFLECYLSIQKTRFQDRLQVKMDAERDALNVEVPNLILQPLVENAIKHGVACKFDAGEILIHASMVQNHLQLVVRDNGPGMVEHDSRMQNGVGLSNTRDRLQRMYGDAHRFNAGNHSDGGFQVVIEIPNELTISTT